MRRGTISVLKLFMPPTLKKLPPTSKKLEGHIALGLCIRPSVCPLVTLFDACHILWTVHAWVLKFYIWIPHGKVADLYQGLHYQSPLSPNAKKNYFWHKKCHLAKANGEKKNLTKKIAIQILPTSAVNCHNFTLLHQLKPSCTCQKVNP